VKNSRFSAEQIIGILKQSEAGAKSSDLCRQHGISAATFYGWRSNRDVILQWRFDPTIPDGKHVEVATEFTSQVGKLTKIPD